ncbi:class I SAM-dependent methyltransferase [Salisediminibacterium halotolerans]|uniref:class I SAM-dependent methyltransferase n=1 Tax=Salisediminibacterium halotolerans TaxID=517425 RepID=UPI000F1C79FA|nr:methyltransferase domain-containing protein [Salisediminibacterium halotolerans]RLJ78027.1 methyltransferase family protein [Actinophytocola xinjiangensis]RPE88635.1 methyltransferase family protein [Salisediminibacterium halotolerans]TWG37004.1 methyltransferase family protein [Salisediminibacterium halotolerans]
MSDLARFMQARQWMKSNENFLVTWHAHVGYTMHLFDAFKSKRTVRDAAATYFLDEELLQCWVDVGLEIGHLKGKRDGKIRAVKSMLKYASASSPESVGILLREMMELHIPTLLEYPERMKSGVYRTYAGDAFGEVVAETSSLLEKAAVPAVLKCVKKHKPESVLDLGCGSGGYLSHIYEETSGVKLQGVEINEAVAKKAARRLNGRAEIFVGSISQFMEQTKQTYSMVMAHNILYYYPPSERTHLLKEFHRVLEKKGVVTIITPLMGAAAGQTFTTAFNAFMTAHTNLYPIPVQSELIKDAKEAGLKVKQIEPLIREGGWYLITLTK